MEAKSLFSPRLFRHNRQSILGVYALDRSIFSLAELHDDLDRLQLDLEQPQTRVPLAS